MKNPMPLHLWVGFNPFSLFALTLQMEAAALVTIFSSFFLSFVFAFLNIAFLYWALNPILIYQTDNLFTFIGPSKTQFPYNVHKRTC